MKQGAIFDMDGLLFDTERMYRDSWKQSAQQFGLVHNPDFPRAVCGSSGAHMREIILQYYPQVDAKAFAEKESAVAAIYNEIYDTLQSIVVPEHHHDHDHSCGGDCCSCSGCH